MRKHYVITYDISCDRIRYRVDKILKNHGIRVQKSIFECDLTESELLKIQKLVRKIIDIEIDSVVFYHLCKKCMSGIESIGVYNIIDKKDVVII
jgi:CRISPR-associated protein Cas2